MEKLPPTLKIPTSTLPSGQVCFNLSKASLSDCDEPSEEAAMSCEDGMSSPRDGSEDGRERERRRSECVGARALARDAPSPGPAPMMTAILRDMFASG